MHISLIINPHRYVNSKEDIKTVDENLMFLSQILDLNLTSSDTNEVIVSKVSISNTVLLATNTLY